MKRLPLLFFLLAWMHFAFTQSLTAAADKKKILIGEPFHVRLQGKFPQGQEVWPAPDTLPHFEILERSAIDTQSNYYGITLTQTLTLTSWDSGLWQLPSFAAGRARSAPEQIMVSFSSPFDPTQPYHDVKDILEVRKPEASNWYWYLVFALILLVLFLLFFPKEKKKEKAGFVPDEGAYKKALRELDELERRQVGGDLLYTSMVRIFREYMHRRRNIQSFSKTTDDLSVQMAGLGLAQAPYQNLVQTLRLSDLVKFARFRSSPEEDRQSLQTIRESMDHIEKLPDAV